MANSFSNLITIFLGLYGGYVALQQKLPTRYPVGFLVCRAFVSLGRKSLINVPFYIGNVQRVSLLLD